jgi:lycopene cyclase domain-containing protein
LHPGSNIYLYLLINLFSVALPVIYSFHKKIRFSREWFYFFASNIPVAAFFIFWDSIFTNLKIWGFNPEYVSGIYFFSLPVEEILFFICIPFASLFTLHVLKVSFKDFHIKEKILNRITPILCLILFVAALIFHNKAYSLYAFLTSSVTLFLVWWYKRSLLSHFYLMFLIILIPFFIVNGILTGTGIEGEVVWYNDAENLGIRMGTIPFEDIFYGFSLLLMNTALMDIIKSGKRTKEQSPGLKNQL